MTMLGRRSMSRDFDGRTAGIRVRVAILDGFTALAIPVTPPVG